MKRYILILSALFAATLSAVAQRPLYIVNGVETEEIESIPPDDIENVSVLKGPAAAALYGSMGQNGVVLITTKSGREQRGIGVTYNGSVTFETAGFWPEFQEEYGPSAVTTSLTNRVASAWGLPGTLTYDGQPVRQQISRYTDGEQFDSCKLR